MKQVSGEETFAVAGATIDQLLEAIDTSSDAFVGVTLLRDPGAPDKFFVRFRGTGGAIRTAVSGLGATMIPVRRLPPTVAYKIEERRGVILVCKPLFQ